MTSLSDTGRFETVQASKYLQQLCKHFAHKVEATYDETQGRAALPPGPATLHADRDSLSVTVTGPDQEGLEVARKIIDSHLARFAFREGFERMDWQQAAGR